MEAEPSNEIAEKNVTPVEELTDVIVPADSDPIPADTTEPIPADITEPTPADITEPIPADITEPIQADTTEPIPADITEPIPADITDPIPADTTEPIPADTTEPIPADTTEPIPADITDPIPADITEPIPADATEPIPADITELIQADTTEPIPADITEPTPADTTEPTPADTTEPTPADTTEPTPADTTEPTPADTTEPTPADATEPIPVGTTEPTPADTTEPTPADTTEPTPADATEPIPVGTTEPIPADTAESKPPVVSTDLVKEEIIAKEIKQENNPVIESAPDNVPKEPVVILPAIHIIETNTALPAPSSGLTSPSSTRSSLSRKESRGKHHKRVSFTGTNEEFKKKVSESRSSIWPLAADFTADTGEKAVGRYVSEQWTLSESWLHCIDYMGEQPALSKRHLFRVKFSQPTRRRPIPAHSASVYFTLVTGEREEEVRVWWEMEGQRLPHRPEEGLFREQWLKDILTSKSLICSETLF